MDKGGGDAPSPDPNIGKAAMAQAKTGEDWLKFATDAFEVSTERQADLDVLTKRVTEQQIGIADEQAGWARSDRDRYESTFKPIEDEFIAEARDYGSPERQAAAAAEAKADVGMASAAARDAAERNAASLGINPASGRFAGISRAGDMGTALATAGAANTARTRVRDKGLALKADVANMGRGLPAQSAQATALGLNAGSSAVGLNQGTNSQFIQSTGIMGEGYGGAMRGYAGQGSTLNQLYNSQLQGWQAQKQADAAGISGLFGGIGTAVGLAFSSSEDVKHDKTDTPDGTALEKVMDMPVEAWTYDQGAGDGGRHVGPYAEDFHDATGSGDGKSIPVQDAIGLTMKAVQDLNAKVDEIAIGLGGAGKTPSKAPAKPTGKPVVKAKKPAPGEPIGLGMAS